MLNWFNALLRPNFCNYFIHDVFPQLMSFQQGQFFAVSARKALRPSHRPACAGMRAMQARVYSERGSQYLLVKAPPASGKSRALMFIGLDKLQNQSIRKVIVAVPERSIGSSFKSTKLSDYGFFRDWEVEDQWNLCTPG